MEPELMEQCGCCKAHRVIKYSWNEPDEYEVCDYCSHLAGLSPYLVLKRQYSLNDFVEYIDEFLIDNNFDIEKIKKGEKKLWPKTSKNEIRTITFLLKNGFNHYAVAIWIEMSLHQIKNVQMHYLGNLKDIFQSKEAALAYIHDGVILDRELEKRGLNGKTQKEKE